MIQEHLSEKEQREIIKYGIERGKIIFASTAVVFVLGIFFNIAYQSMLFLFAFCSLRRYAGGYHANSQKNVILFLLLQ